MEYRTLGRTHLKVSAICLGTMTWGQQNTESDAHDQIDLAMSRGVNFIDTAEMYPVPPKAETQGLTEAYIGSWIAKSGKRDQILLATKATGPSRMAHNPKHIRRGENNFDRKSLTEALNLSLTRLKTDYIDLYQLHWPDRTVNIFGKLNYVHADDEATVPILETLNVLADFVKAGKIRYIGVSNETPWGVSQFLHLAERFNLPRIASIQNPYNLLNRTFEIGLAEFTYREQVGLLAYSPLAFGVLSGKYLNNQRPADGRLSLFSRFSRYTNPQVTLATEKYVNLAKQFGLKPAQMALAYINSRGFVTSNIIGATQICQLQENIASIAITLPQELVDAIDTIHKEQPNPAP